MKQDILVVGSMNMDLVVEAERYPDAGETILGNNFEQTPGGKGANQAVSIGKLKGNVGFIGACGEDYFGDELLTRMKQNGVEVEKVFRAKESTGVANITVEKQGVNRIIVVQGANKCLTPDLIDEFKEEIKKAEIILIQLEIPIETVLQVIELAHKLGTKVILDPAPAQNLPKNIYSKIDYLLPNEGELDQLVADYNLKTETEKINQLLNWGVGTVLVTKGKEGISVYDSQKKEDYQAIELEAVDTTGAGDAFAGAFAFGLKNNYSLRKAVQFANIVAGFSTTKLGAQRSFPDLSELEEFCDQQNLNGELVKKI